MRRIDIVKGICTLDHIAFIRHARTMYKAFLGSLEGLQAQNAIISEVVEGVQLKYVFRVHQDLHSRLRQIATEWWGWEIINRMVFFALTVYF